MRLKAEKEIMSSWLHQTMKRIERLENEQALPRATPLAVDRPQNGMTRPQADRNYNVETNRQDERPANHMPNPKTGTQDNANNRNGSEPKLGAIDSVGCSPIDASKNNAKN